MVGRGDPDGGKDVIRRSAERYAAAIQGKYDEQPERKIA